MHFNCALKLCDKLFSACREISSTILRSQAATREIISVLKYECVKCSPTRLIKYLKIIAQ